MPIPSFVPVDKVSEGRNGENQLGYFWREQEVWIVNGMRVFFAL